MHSSHSAHLTSQEQPRTSYTTPHLKHICVVHGCPNIVRIVATPLTSSISVSFHPPGPVNLANPAAPTQQALTNKSHTTHVTSQAQPQHPLPQACLGRSILQAPQTWPSQPRHYPSSAAHCPMTVQCQHLCASCCQLTWPNARGLLHPTHTC
jgi:hypothetical protein